MFLSRITLTSTLIFLNISFCLFTCEKISPSLLESSNPIIESSLDIAETYLAEGEFIRALNLYDELTSIANEDNIIKMRTTFGSVIAFAAEGSEDKAFEKLSELVELVNQYSCHKIPLNDDHTDSGKPIQGPDKISKEECLERVKGTRDLSIAIVSGLPITSKSKATIVFVLSKLADAAEDCCNMGGIWKACIKPLLDKWEILEAWKKYGAPGLDPSIGE